MTGKIPGVGIDVNYFFAPHLFAGFQAGGELDAPRPERPYRAFDPLVGVQFGGDWLLTPRLSGGFEAQYLHDLHEKAGIYEVLLVLKWFFYSDHSKSPLPMVHQKGSE
jgi:hypothetical protein